MERGLTVCWALMALLLVAGASEDSQEPSGSDNEVASGPEDLDLGPLPPLNNIDPNLRRALLQALTNLEEEAKQRLQDQQPSEDEDKVPESPPEPEVTTTTEAPLVIRVPEPAPTASTSVDAKREEIEKIREEPAPQKKEGDEEKKKKKEEPEVTFFEAPLVAAFTLHHDEQGLPRRVEPLYKPSPSEETASPTAKNFQDQLLVLHQRQVLLKQQQERQEQLQRQRQALLEQREREERQRLLEEQRLRQQLQEQQIRQQLQQQLQQQRFFFSQQQQQQQQQQFQFQQPSGQFFGQPSRPRHLRQEKGTGNAGTVDFQRSVGFQPTDFQRPVVSNGLDFQRSVSNNGVDFQRSVAPNPADFQRGGVSNGGDFQRGSTPNGGDFQRGLVSNGGNFQRGLSPNGGDFQRGLSPNGADFQRGVDFQRSVGVELQPPPAIPFNRDLLQQQQLQLLRLNSNTGFQPINSPPQQPSFNNGFQAAATFSSPFFQAPVNNGFVQRPSPDAQIQNLLFPNFGGPPHEDVNIVSKVLSLNHEGKKTNEISRDSQKKKTETA